MSKIAEMFESYPALAFLATAFVFIFGALIGSFLNVVIHRLPRGESIVAPGSHCPACQKPIAAYDNLPLISYVVLGAKCRHCGAPISARYPVVELLSAVLAVAVFRAFGPAWEALFIFAGAAIFLALTFIDLDSWSLPYALTLPGIVLGLGCAAVTDRFPFWQGLAGAAAGFVFFLLFDRLWRLLTAQTGIGVGDFYLVAMIGAFVGLLQLPLALLLATLQGSIIGLAALPFGGVGRRETAPAHHPDQPAAADGGNGPSQDSPLAEGDGFVPTRRHVPFGPFLVLGALETIFFGPQLLDWYFRLLYG